MWLMVSLFQIAEGWMGKEADCIDDDLVDPDDVASDSD